MAGGKQLNIPGVQGSPAGYQPGLVPRCRDKTPLNPQDAWEAWVFVRCTQAADHKGSHIAVDKATGAKIRF